MNINELAEAVGETPRQIRYLIAEGFVPNPEGSRTRPKYGQAQLDAVRRYQGLREHHRPAEIKALLEAEKLVQQGGSVVLAPGVVLTIDPGALAPNTKPRDIGAIAAAAIANVLKHKSKETPDAA